MPRASNRANDLKERTETPELGFFLNLKPFQAESLDNTRSVTEKYQAHLDDLGIKHFTAEEVLFLGGRHYNPQHKCFGKNAIPKKSLWRNMDETIVQLDKLRKKIGSPLFINSTYRNKSYNTCIDGASGSLHMKFNAIDFRSNTVAPREVARTLRIRRDKGHFKGGIGIYNTFVHIDTRGTNANFKGTTTPQSDFDYVFG